MAKEWIGQCLGVCIVKVLKFAVGEGTESIGINESDIFVELQKTGHADFVSSITSNLDVEVNLGLYLVLIPYLLNKTE